MEDKKTLTPPALLHKLFNGIKRTPRDGTPKRLSDPRHRAARVAKAKKWNEGHNERAKQIAVCPHCPTWFATAAERNAHAAGLPRTPKHRVSP